MRIHDGDNIACIDKFFVYIERNISLYDDMHENKKKYTIAPIGYYEKQSGEIKALNECNYIPFSDAHPTDTLEGTVDCLIKAVVEIAEKEKNHPDYDMSFGISFKSNNPPIMILPRSGLEFLVSIEELSGKDIKEFTDIFIKKFGKLADSDIASQQIAAESRRAENRKNKSYK